MRFLVFDSLLPPLLLHTALTSFFYFPLLPPAHTSCSCFPLFSLAWLPLLLPGLPVLSALTVILLLLPTLTSWSHFSLLLLPSITTFSYFLLLSTAPNFFFLLPAFTFWQLFPIPLPALYYVHLLIAPSKYFYFLLFLLSCSCSSFQLLLSALTSSTYFQSKILFILTKIYVIFTLIHSKIPWY